MSDLFPGRNSMVLWKGKKIQIQTQMHMDSNPPEIGTVVIKNGQVIKRKTTPVGDFLNQPNGSKKVNELLQKQHQEIYQTIDNKAKERMAQERKIKEALAKQKQEQEQANAPQAPEKKSGGFKEMIAGLFGKRKKGEEKE